MVPVQAKIKNAVQIGLQKDLGTDYWKDPKERLLATQEQQWTGKHRLGKP